MRYKRDCMQLMNQIESKETMAHIQNILIFSALCVLAVTLAQTAQGGPHTSQEGPPTSQGGPHENQGRARRQAPGFGTFDITLSKANWTTCDVTIFPRISCHDCNTRLICKQVGGLLKECTDPTRPHCNNGVCSAVPSVECA